MEAKYDNGKLGNAEEEPNQIRLSAPWGDLACYQNVAGRLGRTDLKDFIHQRTRAHMLYIQEEARTKRLTLVISAVFLLGAIAVILFAPDDREIRSFLLSGVLLVFAAGTFGYKRVYGKTKGGSFGADMGDNERSSMSLES